MESINTQTLVHAGVELVVIGGLVFWFQRKTSLLQDRIDQLQDRLTKSEELMNRQTKLLTEHEQILRQIIGGISHDSYRSPNPRNSPPQYQNNSNVVENEEEFSEGELDNLLKEELGSLDHSKHKKSKQPDFIELECNGDTCELKDTPKKTRLKKKKSKRKVRING